MSLSNFRVPNIPAGTMLQPKPSYRFRVLIMPPNNMPGAMNSFIVLARNVQEVSRPEIRHDRVDVHLYNSRAYYAGKHEWSEINLTIRDDVCNEALRRVVELYYAQFDHQNQSGAKAASAYKFDMFVQTLDGRNGVDTVTTLDSWNLQGCFFTNLSFGELNYTAGGAFITIRCTISFDHATLVTDGTTVVDRSINLDACGLSLLETVGPRGGFSVSAGVSVEL